MPAAAVSLYPQSCCSAPEGYSGHKTARNDVLMVEESYSVVDYLFGPNPLPSVYYP